ncbi:MAG: gamma-glutamyltransferase [Deinococcota bacterium]
MSQPFYAAASSGHPEVTKAAITMLDAGGNAFDAIVAAGLAASVAEPALTSLAGGGFLLAKNQQGARLFDFFADTPTLPSKLPDNLDFEAVTVYFPGSTQVFHAGLGSVAVPGTLKGLLHAHTHLGRMPLHDVAEPTIQLARDGLAINSAQEHVMAIITPIMTLSAPAKALYAPKGHSLRADDWFTNPQLAAFLDALPGSADDFYLGELAGRIAEEMTAGGGLLTKQDLAQYQVIEREPLRYQYREFELLTNPAPSFGGGLIAVALELLSRRPVRHTDITTSPERALALAQCLYDTDQLRKQGVLHPDALETPQPDAPILRSSGGTTHMSVCDDAGNAASMTLSAGEGAGYLAADTGIMYNNMLGEDDLFPEGFHRFASNSRVASMMSPSMICDAQGQVQMVLGTGGSKRIRTTLFQMISHLLDANMPLEAATSTPRMHWDGAQLQLEPGFSDEVVQSLESAFPLNMWSQPNLYFGGVHAVSSHGEAVGDARRGGAAQVLQKKV